MVLLKQVLIQHLFDICSLRQTLQDAEVNVAYRWFLGYTMSQHLSHFATISYAFRHRITAEVIEAVFQWILEEVVRTGVSVCGSCVCGWNTSQNECEPEKTSEKGHTGSVETLSVAAG